MFKLGIESTDIFLDIINHVSGYHDKNYYKDSFPENK